MDYFAIVKKAFNITIKNKYLWLFGFFAGVSGGSYNFYSGGGDRSAVDQKMGDYNFQQFSSDAKYFFLDNLAWIIIVGALFVSLIIFFLVLRILSQGALIGAVNNIDNSKKSGVRAGFKIGKKYFWRIFGLGFLSGAVVFLTILILGTPIIFLFMYEMYVRGIILALLGAVIFIPLMIVINYMTLYGSRYIVLNDEKIFQSLKSAFGLFMKNIWQSIVFSLILILASIAAMIITLLIFCALAMPFVLLGFLAYLVANWLGVVVVGGLGIIIFLGLIFVLGAILATFQSSLWTLAFKELIKR